jgi:1-acyl-sn-glycerol-3-phosphate acyltransferase
MPPLTSQVLRPEALSLPQSSRWWRGPLDVISMAVGLSYWAVALLVVLLLAPPLRLFARGRRAEILGRYFLHRFFSSFVKLLRLMDLVHADLESLDCLKHEKQPVILAPNHTSLWDVVFVLAKSPQTICIMKESLLANPFFGTGARLVGFIPNGSSGKMVRDAVGALDKGGQLLIFPEATRTRRDARWINPLRGGCALIARKAGVPIRPIFIRTNSRFLEKGWPLWKKPVFPIRISLELGEPVYPQEDESTHEFTQRLEGIFMKNLSRAHRLRRQVMRDHPPGTNS